MKGAVSIRNLAKRFGPTPAVADLSLEIVAGEFLSLLGPSGCGKTTTLRMVAGFLEPDAGSIAVDGRTLSTPGRVVRPEGRGMSMVFQSYALWPHMTVFENVAYGLKLKPAFRANTKARTMAMLDTVQMGAYATRYPGQLSGGQQQRVALARALAVEPTVLLMDEPLSNLDAHLREEMRIEIRRLHAEVRVTTIYVTHDLVEAMVVSDRIVVMQSGRIEQVGVPEEIYNAPRTRFVAGFIGKTNFIPAQVDASGPEPSVRIGTHRLRVARDRIGHIEHGRSVTVALRAHDLLIAQGLAETTNGVDVVPAVVTEHVFLGDQREYVVDVPALAAKLRVVTRADQRHQVGDNVLISIPPSKCLVVDQ